MSYNPDNIARKLVAAADAVLVGRVAIPGTRTEELTLFWRVSDERLASQSLAYLNKHTSTLNADNPRRWVIDPIASNESQRGTWRLHSNRLSKDTKIPSMPTEPGIICTLRLGLLMALPPDEASDTEARCRLVAHDPRTGLLSLSRYWRNFDRQSIHAVAAQVASRTRIENPTAEREMPADAEHPNPDTGDPYVRTFSGVFAVKGRIEEDDDGLTFTVIEDMVEVVTIPQSNSAAALAATGPVITSEKEVLDIFQRQPGTGWGVAYLFNRIDPLSRSVCEGISDADLITACGVTGHTVAQRKFEIMDDNTARFSVLFRKVAWQNVSTFYVESVNNPGGYGKTHRQVAPNVPVGDAPTLVAAQTDETVLARGYSEKGDGRADVFKETQEGTEAEVVVEITPAVLDQRPSWEKHWYRVPPSAVSARFTTAQTYAGPSSKTHTGARLQLGADGYANITASAADLDEHNAEIEVQPTIVGVQRGRKVKAWFNVKPADVGQRYTDAQAYTGGLSHAGAKKNVHASKWATITAEAVDLTQSGGAWPWTAKSDLICTYAKQIAWDRDYEEPTYVLYKETYDVKYHATESAAWDELSGACSGSTGPTRVDGAPTLYYRTLKVKKIEVSEPYMPGETAANFETIEQSA